MIIKMKWFLKLIGKYIFNEEIEGITLFPFIIVGTTKPSKVLVNHEKIHLVQQLECLIVLFYLIYVFNYLANRIKYKNDKAYRRILFEREAYNNMCKLEYLRTRKFYTWLYVS